MSEQITERLMRELLGMESWRLYREEVERRMEAHVGAIMRGDLSHDEYVRESSAYTTLKSMLLYPVQAANYEE
jgi:hypothetical protein